MTSSAPLITPLSSAAIACAILKVDAGGSRTSQMASGSRRSSPLATSSRRKQLPAGGAGCTVCVAPVEHAQTGAVDVEVRVVQVVVLDRLRHAVRGELVAQLREPWREGSQPIDLLACERH